MQNDFVRGLNLAIGMRVCNSSEPGMVTILGKAVVELVCVKLAFAFKYHYIRYPQTCHDSLPYEVVYLSHCDGCYSFIL